MINDHHPQVGTLHIRDDVHRTITKQSACNHDKIVIKAGVYPLHLRNECLIAKPLAYLLHSYNVDRLLSVTSVESRTHADGEVPYDYYWTWGSSAEKYYLPHFDSQEHGQFCIRLERPWVLTPHHNGHYYDCGQPVIRYTVDNLEANEAWGR